jgi:hypothetical protein
VIAQVDGGTTGSGGGAQAPAKPAGPRPGLDPGAIADTVLNEAVVRVSTVVKPAAAAAVATTFSFPLVLMLAVLLFLLVQRWLDARDPKLRAAPRSTAETWLEFQDEERL